MRDDFTIDVKRHLAARVGHLCSNPLCRALTAGPQNNSESSVNIGVAAHISAASSGGPRYDPLLTPSERSHIDNGIWLCQNCAKLIDSDLARFSTSLVRGWKLVAEDIARNALGKTSGSLVEPKEALSGLHCILELEGIVGYTYDPRMTPVRKFSISLKNVGRATVKFPSLSFRRSLGLSVDEFGIDGNYNHGLPLAPGNGEWISFNGGSNDVIRNNQTLLIAKLLQRGQNMGVEGISVDEYPHLFGSRGPSHSRWVFKGVAFVCELAGDAIPTITSPHAIEPDAIIWQHS